MTLDWTVTKKAIHDWVVAGTALTATSVLWAGQNKALRPSGAWASIRIVADRTRGYGWVRTTTVENPTAGQELLATVENTTEAQLRVTVRNPDAADFIEVMAVVRRLEASSALQSQRRLLRNANIGFLGAGDIRSTEAVIQTTIVEPQASVDFRLQLSSALTEYLTYIETFEISGNVDR